MGPWRTAPQTIQARYAVASKLVLEPIAPHRYRAVLDPQHPAPVSSPSTSHRVTLTDTGESYACHGDESVLNGMARLGKRGIPVGCRGGGCGVCKVAVLSGSFRKRVMSRSHVSEDDEAHQRVLACCIFPEADLRLKVIGGLQKAVTRPTVLPWQPER